MLGASTIGLYIHISTITATLIPHIGKGPKYLDRHSVNNNKLPLMEILDISHKDCSNWCNNTTITTLATYNNGSVEAVWLARLVGTQTHVYQTAYMYM